MNRTRTRFLALAVGVLMALAGCGGSGGTSTAATTALSVKQTHTVERKFTLEADQICFLDAFKRTEVNQRAKSLPALGHDVPSLVAMDRQMLDKLRPLKAPPSLSADWSQILAGITQTTELTAQLGTAAARADAKQVTKLAAAMKEVRARIHPIAKRDGFAVCGRST